MQCCMYICMYTMYFTICYQERCDVDSNLRLQSTLGGAGIIHNESKNKDASTCAELRSLINLLPQNHAAPVNDAIPPA